MSPPILYYANLSPPSRAVILTAQEIGLELNLKPISLFKREHLTPEFIKVSILYKYYVLGQSIKYYLII